MQLFDRIQTKDEILNRIQDRLKSVINAIAKKPLIDGQLLTGVTITTSNSPVAHGLGRVPNGWCIVNGAADQVFENADSDARFLNLATNSLTLNNVKIWVF